MLIYAIFPQSLEQRGYFGSTEADHKMAIDRHLFIPHFFAAFSLFNVMHEESIFPVWKIELKLIF